MLKLGSRSSQLARWQAEHVRDRLTELSIDVEIVYMTTEGDRSTQSLREFGGQGAFTKGIQQEILDGRIDFAVHSLKDLPTEVIEGLTLASVPEREDPSDVFVSSNYASWQDLPTGSRVGTGSLRRQAQLLHHRSELRVEDIRGNVDTRLRKLDSGDYDALVLAKAGLTRLELTDRITEVFSLDTMLPAIGQGALGLECRADDATTIQALQRILHPATFVSVVAERSLLRELRAGCLAPVGAHSNVDSDGILQLTAVVLSQDGTSRIEASGAAAWGQVEWSGLAGDDPEWHEQYPDQAHDLGVRVATSLKDSGADRLLDRS